MSPCQRPSVAAICKVCYVDPTIRGLEELDETSSNLTLASLGVADQGNYSCAGRNFISAGQPDILVLEITG